MDKKCSRCGETKDVVFFYRQKRSKDGYAPHCKHCDDKRTALWRSDNIDMVNERSRKYSREWRDNNSDKTIQYYKNYYDRHTKDICLRKGAQMAKTRQKRIELAKTLLGDKCVICGESEWCCLDYHHLIPEEKLHGEDTLSHWLNGTEERLINNINRTHAVLLCKNCHTKVHNNIISLEDNKWTRSLTLVKETEKEEKTRKEVLQKSLAVNA